MIGLASLLKKSSKLLLPYFESTNKIQNRALLIAYFAANLIQALVVMFLFSYMSIFLGMFAMPTVTYQLFFATLIDFTATLFIYGAGQACKYLATAKLKMSLVDSLNQDLGERWLDSKQHAYFGIHLQKKQVYPNKVLRDDVKNVVDKTLELLDISISTFFGFFIGIYKLSAMSAMLAFEFMGREIAVPGLMAMGSVLYAIAYNMISSRISKPLEALTSLRKDEEGRLQNVIHHIDSHPEAIALQGSAPNERVFYNQGLIRLNRTRENELRITTWLKFVGKVHQYLSVAVGLIMAAPSIIAKKVQATDVLEINHYFSDIIGFFTATQENIELITPLNTSIDRIQDFQKALKSWEDLKSEHHCTKFDQKQFKLEDFTLKTPAGKALLHHASATLDTGKITLLEGMTGTGKSTLIKAIAGIWPHAKGKCSIPAKESETHIIPQKPCLPYQSTLFEALTYSLSESESKQVKVHSVIKMLTELGLKDLAKDLKQNKNNVRSWSSLSGGELQRLAIIGAALKKPKVLILDESLSALDETKKKDAIAFIKKHIPATTLVIDHQPKLNHQSPYYHAKLTMRGQKLVKSSHRTL